MIHLLLKVFVQLRLKIAKANHLNKFLFVCVILYQPFTQAATIIDAQRLAYKAYLQSLSKQDQPAANLQLKALTGYPLERYAQYRYLLTFSDQTQPSDLKNFVLSEPDSALNASLISFFIKKWGEQGDFKTVYEAVTVLSNEQLNQSNLNTLQNCFIGEAYLHNGKTQQAVEIAKRVWLTGKSLPDACDTLLSAWAETDRTDQDVLARIELAFADKNHSLVAYLIKQLSAQSDVLIKALNKLNTSTDSLAEFIGVKPTAFTQRIALLAYDQLARKDIPTAQALLSDLITKQQLSNEQAVTAKTSLLKQLLFLNRPNADQIKQRENLLDELKNSAVSDELHEFRLRIALRESDWDYLRKGISRLTTDKQNSQTWRFWQAYLGWAFGEQQEKQASEKQLVALINERGFYPMAAAQLLNVDYPFVPEITAKQALSDINKIEQLRDVKRVEEFLYWGQIGPANREWIHAIKNSDPQTQLALARYAYEQNWHPLTVQATITAKLWDHIEERFPLAWEELFTKHLADKSFSKNYAMAIARQESAWNPEVISPAGAKGLMQVMPATAKHVADKFTIDAYTSDQQLLEPEMNIKIGTTYLESLQQDYANNRIFSTAAYNAGPSRVKMWRDRTQGNVNVLQFVESISFAETRDYVKNVLSFDMYYRLLHNLRTEQEPVGFLFSEDEWQASY